MSQIRELLDPNNTLHAVELVTTHTKSWDNLLREDERIVVEGKEVGKCTIVTELGYVGEYKAHFDGVEIAEDKRGQGIGLAVYLLAIERTLARGLPFETQDSTQTGNAKRVWELLVQKGLAEEIEPFEPYLGIEDRYTGRYRVNNLQTPQEKLQPPTDPKLA